MIYLLHSIVIFDRGYPSYDMFDYLNNKGLLFLMRVSTSFKLAQSVDDNKDKALNSTYQSNRNFILGQVFKRIVQLLVKYKSRNKILQSILKKATKIRSQVRCNRSCKRKNKHPRKKHHHNIKSCI